MDLRPVDLAPAAAYQALRARDARFDGRLFVGVTSTGVYCRPICRVRTPMEKNCRFFATAAQAEAGAFRPCLKCRPEIAPGAGPAWTVMEASTTLARQAADELDACIADEGPARLDRLAHRLGISDRHLRRVFQREHGIAPKQYLQTRRLLLAKQLLTDTRLPVAQVALASGYQSLRRFNAAFVAAYRLTPSRLRGGGTDESARPGPGRPAIDLQLGFRPPYDVDSLLGFVARRAVPEVESVHGRCIRRSLRAGTFAAQAGWLEVEFDAARPVLRVRFAAELAGSSGRIVAAVRRWLDLDADPATIDAALATLPGAPGLRLPGCVDAFEVAVRAVLGQQVTVAAARTLARRLVERFGVPVATPWPEIDHAFPAPDALAAARVDDVAALGIIRTRAAAIVAIAAAWPALAPRLATTARPEPAIAALCALPGVGPWTAHYIAMRALGWPDAFPPNDVAVRKAMHVQAGAALSAGALNDAALAWQPWRSYAVLRLWNSLGPSP